VEEWPRQKQICFWRRTTTSVFGARFGDCSPRVRTESISRAQRSIEPDFGAPAWPVDSLLVKAPQNALPVDASWRCLQQRFKTTGGHDRERCAGFGPRKGFQRDGGSDLRPLPRLPVFDRRWTILDWRAARSRPHVCGVRSRSSEDDRPACRASPIASGLPCRAAHPMRGSRSTPLPSVTCRKDALASPFRVSRFPIPRSGPTPVERRIPVIRRRSLLSPHTQSQPRTSSRVDLTGLPLALVGAGWPHCALGFVACALKTIALCAVSGAFYRPEDLTSPQILDEPVRALPSYSKTVAGHPRGSPIAERWIVQTISICIPFRRRRFRRNGDSDERGSEKRLLAIRSAPISPLSTKSGSVLAHASGALQRPERPKARPEGRLGSPPREGRRAARARDTNDWRRTVRSAAPPEGDSPRRAFGIEVGYGPLARVGPATTG